MALETITVEKPDICLMKVLCYNIGVKLECKDCRYRADKCN